MLAKNNRESTTSTLGCRHSSVVEHLVKQFVDNFSLNVFKEKEVAKLKTIEKDKLLKNSVVLIVLSDESKSEDGRAYSEENEYKMVITTDCNIQEFKKKKQCVEYMMM
jgi:hypothetical protein